jgi:hypothetical protein
VQKWVKPKKSNVMPTLSHFAQAQDAFVRNTVLEKTEDP